MARINISIPDELKERMDAIENLNWSAVAAQAFEVETRRHQRIVNMEQAQIVDRLRASYEKRHVVEHDNGHQHGVKWAAEIAEADELMWLADNQDGAAEALMQSSHLDGTPFENIDLEEFWLWQVRAERLPSRAFADGFVTGAIEVWETVEDEVRG